MKPSVKSEIEITGVKGAPVVFNSGVFGELPRRWKGLIKWRPIFILGLRKLIQ
jgi:hypothetical protein